MAKRFVMLYVKRRKTPIILSGHLKFDGSEDDNGLGRMVYGIDDNGKQHHIDFDSIQLIELVKIGK